MQAAELGLIPDSAAREAVGPGWPLLVQFAGFNSGIFGFLLFLLLLSTSLPVL